MNDRTRRPTMAPEDDPSIPVLTERLTLPVPAAGSKPAAQAAAAEAVVDSMVFPKAAPANKPVPTAAAGVTSRPALHPFELPPAPGAITAPAARATGAAPSAPAVASPASPAMPLPAAASAPAQIAPVTPAPLIAPTAPRAPAASGATLASAVMPDANAIRSAVLDDLAARLPREIESLMRKQLAGSIEAAVQAASTDLAARIRNAAAQSLQNLVEQAVKAEIARLRLPPPPK